MNIFNFRTIAILTCCFCLSGCFFINNLKCAIQNNCGDPTDEITPEINVKFGVLNSLPSSKNLQIGVLSKSDIESVRTKPHLIKALKNAGQKPIEGKSLYTTDFSMENMSKLRNRPVYGSTGISSVTPNYAGGYNVNQGYGIIGYETVINYDTCFFLSVIKNGTGELYRSYLCFETVPNSYKKFTYEFIEDIYSRFFNASDTNEVFLCSRQKNKLGHYCELTDDFYELNSKN